MKFYLKGGRIAPFWRPFYKKYTIRHTIGNEIYEIEYRRVPFWTNEPTTFGFFLRKKLCNWWGRVWLILPNGSRMMAGLDAHPHTRCFFPKKFMRKKLVACARKCYIHHHHRHVNIERKENTTKNEQ